MRRSMRMIALLAVAALSASAPRVSAAQDRGLAPRSPSAGDQATLGRYRAILFAVGEQAAGSDLPNLRFPVSEADSLRSVLSRQYTFDPNDVQVVRNPTGDQIIDALDSLARVLGPDDNLLVVYSGHGYYDRDGQEGYWQAHDAHSQRKSTWLANSEVRTVMRKLRARQVLVITDACFSGALTRGGGVELAPEGESLEFGLRVGGRTSRRAITAGGFDEPVPAASVFAVELVKTLRGNRSAIMTAGRLAMLIRPGVAAAARTSVQYGAFAGVADEQGDFVFVSRDARLGAAGAAPPSRAPTATVPATTPPASAPVARDESGVKAAFVGCWRYPTGDLLRISADGAVAGARLPGRWTAASARRYTIQWPTMTDYVALSENGRTLTGVNNYQLPARASRTGTPVVDRRSLAGSWTYNNIPAIATPDGTLTAGPFRGTWRNTGPDAFEVAWTHAPVDDLTVTADGLELKGSNNLGAMISAARTTCPP